MAGAIQGAATLITQVQAFVLCGFLPQFCNELALFWKYTDRRTSGRNTPVRCIAMVRREKILVLWNNSRKLSCLTIGEVKLLFSTIIWWHSKHLVWLLHSQLVVCAWQQLAKYAANHLIQYCEVMSKSVHFLLKNPQLICAAGKSTPTIAGAIKSLTTVQYPYSYQELIPQY